MSKINTNERLVAFPIREHATAFVPEDGVPFRRATVGITYPFSDYRIRRSASHSITLFEYVIEGEGEVLIGGVWQKAVAGDVYILPAGEVHEYRANRARPWRKIWVNYVADYIDGFLRAYHVGAGVYRAEEARPIFEELLAISESSEGGPQVAITLSELIHRAVALIATEKITRPGGDRDEYRLRAALATRVYEKFNLDLLAEELHLSKSQIIRSFKQLYGTTPYDYFIGLKIDNAKILLRDTTMKIKEIADRLSISDEHYFSAMFRDRVGMSPREYRTAKQREIRKNS